MISYIYPILVYAEEKTGYYIEVNITQNIVSIYDQNGVIQKTFYCSTGGVTPTGTYYTSDKYPWRMLFGNVYGQYATRIHSNILFHSVPYSHTDKSSLKYEEYNKLGQKASSGCIRLAVKDAKWIYDNCDSGTKVYLYKSSEPLEILPKPPFKIDVNDLEKRGWDPTDPDLANPWKKIVQWIDDTPVFFKKMIITYHNENYDCDGFIYEDRTYLCRDDINKIFYKYANSESQTISEDIVSVSLDDIVYYRLRDIIDENNLLIEWNDNEIIIRNYEIMPYEQEKYELEESIEKQPNQEDDFVNEEDDKQNNFNLESNMLDKIDIIQD
jgi:hypothetical protein